MPSLTSLMLGITTENLHFTDFLVKVVRPKCFEKLDLVQFIVYCIVSGNILLYSHYIYDVLLFVLYNILSFSVELSINL